MYVMHFVRLANCTAIKDEVSAQDNHILACNFAKYSPVLETFSLTNSAVNQRWNWVTFCDPATQ